MDAGTPCGEAGQRARRGRETQRLHTGLTVAVAGGCTHLLARARLCKRRGGLAQRVDVIADGSVGTTQAVSGVSGSGIALREHLRRFGGVLTP